MGILVAWAKKNSSIVAKTFGGGFLGDEKWLVPADLYGVLGMAGDNQTSFSSPTDFFYVSFSPLSRFSNLLFSFKLLKPIVLPRHGAGTRL